MKLLKRLLALFACTAAVVGGVMAVDAAPAAAATSCYGDYCSGKSPSATTAPDGHYCIEDGRPIQSTPIYSDSGALTLGPVSYNIGGVYLGSIELTWSQRCQTNWARVNVAQTMDWVNTIGVRQLGTNYEQVVQTPLPGVYLYSGLYWTI